MIETCIFCKIVAGLAPCFEIARDDRALAFMDINPASPGHVLVVSTEHAADLHGVSPEGLAAAALMARRVAGAVEKVLAPDGINLIQANGPGAAQSVAHFHIHVLPRKMGDQLPINWLLSPGDRTAIGALAERLKAAL
ncbi:MAG: HIT domain-containing protein [Alphaproteobacteria bacterium]|nr:HIT domain-containing protein [Alphaproteobacteria bacterium]